MSQILEHCSHQKMGPNSSPLNFVSCFRWAKYDRNDGMWLGHERYHGFLLFFLSDHSLWGKPLPCHKDTPTALWGGPCNEDLRPFAHCQWEAEASCQYLWKYAILEAEPPSPVEPSSNQHPTQQLDYKFMIDLSCSWISEAQKLCEIINAHCFKPLNFEVVGYATSNN